MKRNTLKPTAARLMRELRWLVGTLSVRSYTGRSIFLLWSLSCLFKLDSQLCYQENGSQEKQVGKKDPIDLLTKLKVFLLEYEYLTIAEYLNLNNEHWFCSKRKLSSQIFSRWCGRGPASRTEQKALWHFKFSIVLIIHKQLKIEGKEFKINLLEDSKVEFNRNFSFITRDWN